MLELESRGLEEASLRSDGKMTPGLDLVLPAAHGAATSLPSLFALPVTSELIFILQFFLVGHCPGTSAGFCVNMCFYFSWVRDLEWDWWAVWYVNIYLSF